MKHLLRATGREFFAEMERQGLGVANVKTLGLLTDADGPLSIKALSEELGLSLPGVSRSVDKLVQKGLVTREEDPSDRRSRLLGLTAKGRKTFEALIELRLAGIQEWVGTLSEQEFEALAEGIRPIVSRL